MKFAKKNFYSVFIIFIFILTYGNTITTIQNFNLALQPHPKAKVSDAIVPEQKLSTEESVLDSFNVNPLNRWSVNDASTSTTVSNGQLQSENVDNGSRGSHYFMRRDLTKTDSKLEYRYSDASSNSNNQSEYFRDQLGSAMTFDSSTQGWTVLNSATVSQSNGQLKIISTAANGGTKYTLPSLVSRNIYTNISFDIYCSSAITIFIRTNDYESTIIYGYKYYSFTCPTSLTTENLIYSSFFNSGNELNVFNYLQFYTSNSGTNTFYLDNIKLLGSYDYATYNSGSTWDWEDSKEYSYNVYNNITNFQDGTTENYTAQTTGLTVSNYANQYLNESYSGAGTGNLQIRRQSLSITASTYKYFLIEFNSSVNISTVEIVDADGHAVYDDATGWSSSGGQFHISYGQITSGFWTGTETTLRIYFYFYTSLTSAQILVNCIYLYDSSLGNLEGWTSTASTNHYNYVDPQGYFIDKIINSASNSNTRSDTGLNIDSSIFKYLTIRIKADSSSSRYFQIAETTSSTAGLTSWNALSSSFQTFTFDLSNSSSWTGTIGYLRIYLGSTSAGAAPVNNSLFTIDYILLTTGIQANTTVTTIGMYDKSTGYSIFNITDSYINSSYFRYEVYLFSNASTVGAYYYTSYIPYVYQQYYRIKVTYNTETTSLTVEFLYDNLTRIAKISYPKDFTVISSTNTFFSFIGLPTLFVDISSPLYGNSTSYIDYIDAPYATNLWSHYTSPDGTYLVDNGPTATRLNQNLTAGTYPTNAYRLYIEKMDAVSLTLSTTNSNFTDSSGGSSYTSYYTRFIVYGINYKTGALHEVLRVRMLTTLFYDSGSTTYYTYTALQIYRNSVQQITYDGLGTLHYISSSTHYVDAKADLSIATSNNRDTLTLNARLYQDTTDLNTYYDYSIKFNSSTYVTNSAPDYVVETNVYAVQSAPGSNFITIRFDNFAKRTHDFFSDPIGTIVGGFLGILAGIFNFLLSLVSLIFIPFILLIITIITSLTSSVINSIVEIATSIYTLLSPLFNSLASAIADIASGIWSAFSSAAGQFITDFVDALANIIDLFNTNIIQPIIQFLVGLVNYIINTVIPFIATAWDSLVYGILHIFDSTDGLYNAVVNMTTFFTDFITNIINMISFIGLLAPWIVIFLVFYMISLPFFSNEDSSGRINLGGALRDIFDHSFNRGVTTPSPSFFGFNTGSYYIPLILIVYVILKLMIANGTFPDIFSGLPI